LYTSYCSCLHIRYKFRDFYFGEFLKIVKIGQNYIPAKKKKGYTVSRVSRALSMVSRALSMVSNVYRIFVHFMVTALFSPVHSTESPILGIGLGYDVSCRGLWDQPHPWYLVLFMVSAFMTSPVHGTEIRPVHDICTI
jgi:hypothetical protein